MKNDRTIVLTAIRQNYYALTYLSKDVAKSFLNDREIGLIIIKQRSNRLNILQEPLRNDHTIVLTAVSNDGLVLRYASESLRNDRTIVLAAVKQNERALVYASERLQKQFENYYRRKNFLQVLVGNKIITYDSIADPDILALKVFSTVGLINEICGFI